MVRDSLSLSEFISFSLSLFYQTSLSPRAWMEAMRIKSSFYLSLDRSFRVPKKRKIGGGSGLF